VHRHALIADFFPIAQASLMQLPAFRFLMCFYPAHPIRSPKPIYAPSQPARTATSEPILPRLSEKPELVPSRDGLLLSRHPSTPLGRLQLHQVPAIQSLCRPPPQPRKHCRRRRMRLVSRSITEDTWRSLSQTKTSLRSPRRICYSPFRVYDHPRCDPCTSRARRPQFTIAILGVFRTLFRSYVNVWSGLCNIPASIFHLLAACKSN
jgi:hypothetical protein